LTSHAAIIPSSSRVSIAFMRRDSGYSDVIVDTRRNDLYKGLLVRGGNSEDEYDSDMDLDTDTDTDNESDEDLEDEEEGTEAEAEESDDSDEEDKDEEESDEDEDEEEEEEVSKPSSSSSSPVKITLKTALSNNILIDQSIEITASPTRTVQSLKQSVSRQFKSRPPMDSIVLRLDGQVLDDDDVVVEDLVDEDDEDDEDEDDEDDDGLPKLTIVVDMVPPVDPKFGTEMKQRLDDMTNEEVLDAYTANLASLHQNSMDLVSSQKEDNNDSTDRDDEDNEDTDDEEEHPRHSILPTNLAMQSHALMLKDQITESLSADEKILLAKKDKPSSPALEDEDSTDSFGSGDVLLKESIKRRKRRGGATMNVKRALQKNLNINWPDTIRNFLLFLFFGYFGGRNAMSRTIMLLGAPACFIIQARPVKVAIKQLVYTIGKPPGILLSLLPAPQQAIMSCDYDEALKGIYGDDVDQFNDVINDTNAGIVQDESDFDDEDEDAESDGEYDDEYDDEEDF